MSSASARLLCKIVTVFLLFCLTKVNGETCLSYGHSCWGGHGKRNGPANFAGSAVQKRTGSWYLSKLFGPPLERPNRLPTPYIPAQGEDDLEKLQKYGYQVFPALDTKEFSARGDPKDSDADFKSGKWGPEESRDTSDEVMVLMTPEVHVPFSKYKYLQVVNRANDKRGIEN